MDIIKPQATIQLISHGRVPAIQAAELQIGDVMVWNFGYTSTVVDITPRGKTQITIIEQSNDMDRKQYTRTFSKTRLVAVKGE